MANFPHVKGPPQERQGELKRHPAKRARRRAFKLARSQPSRFRKPSLRCEKLERSFVALNRLAVKLKREKRDVEPKVLATEFLVVLNDPTVSEP